MDERIELADLLRAVSRCIAAAPIERRKHLDVMLANYAFDQRTDYAWATGGQSPMLLCHLLFAIKEACQPEELEELAEQKTRGSA